MLPHAIRLAALVPLLAGGAGVLLGVRFLGEAGGPATESHLRYLSGLLLGLGLLALWCANDLPNRGTPLTILCAVVAIGGLARLLGVFTHGVPPTPHLLALVMELVITPALWLWWNATR